MLTESQKIFFLYLTVHKVFGLSYFGNILKMFMCNRVHSKDRTAIGHILLIEHIIFLLILLKKDYANAPLAAVRLFPLMIHNKFKVLLNTFTCATKFRFIRFLISI